MEQQNKQLNLLQEEPLKLTSSSSRQYTCTYVEVFQVSKMKIKNQIWCKKSNSAWFTKNNILEQK